MRRSFCLLFVLWMFMWGSLWAQVPAEDSARTRLLVGLKGQVGFIIIHSPALNAVRRSYPWGAEADIGWQFVNQKAWEFCNCYPRAGVATTFWDWGNRPVLGYGLTSVAYVEPVFLTRYRLNLSIRLGGGIAYMSRPYDEVDNPDNQAYSTYINFPLMVNAGLTYRFSPHLQMRITGNFNHVSNGGLRLPNKGINYPTLGGGLEYAFKAIDFKERAKVERNEVPKPRFRPHVFLLSTFKNGEIGNNKQYGVFGGGLGAAYYLGRWSGLNAGAEWVVDNARRARMNYWGYGGSVSRAGILLGHQFKMGRVIFSQQLGVYVYDSWKENDPVYQRFGLSFLFTDHIFAGVNLKTHRHVADFLDFRVGWQF